MGLIDLHRSRQGDPRGGARTRRRAPRRDPGRAYLRHDLRHRHGGRRGRGLPSAAEPSMSRRRSATPLCSSRSRPWCWAAWAVLPVRLWPACCSASSRLFAASIFGESLGQIGIFVDLHPCSAVSPDRAVRGARMNASPERQDPGIAVACSVVVRSVRRAIRILAVVLDAGSDVRVSRPVLERARRLRRAVFVRACAVLWHRRLRHRRAAGAARRECLCCRRDRHRMFRRRSAGSSAFWCSAIGCAAPILRW